jgi:hypothetical protein
MGRGEERKYMDLEESSEDAIYRLANASFWRFYGSRQNIAASRIRTARCRDCLRESTLHAVVQAFPRNNQPIERSFTHPRHFLNFVNYPI